MQLGQEFHAFRTTIQTEIRSLKQRSMPLRLSRSILGGTAIGTGLNTDSPLTLHAVMAELRGVSRGDQWSVQPGPDRGDHPIVGALSCFPVS
ncbi:lyase family protein [Komagataeibacter saccharivorans]|uniref:lyase family protein n=1 Tax=Komagataeibacter saccharivorans TaxID=265959 RepID=UPI002155EB43|nr:lyase family protein [Komagataeibacter saccharivorans]